MDKNELVKMMVQKTNLKRSDTERLVNAFMETVSEELKTKKRLTLVGYGTSGFAHKKSLPDINQKTVLTLSIKGGRIGALEKEPIGGGGLPFPRK